MKQFGVVQEYVIALNCLKIRIIWVMLKIQIQISRGQMNKHDKNWPLLSISYAIIVMLNIINKMN